jgi:hypothetical protein
MGGGIKWITIEAYKIPFGVQKLPVMDIEREIGVFIDDPGDLNIKTIVHIICARVHGTK